MDLNIIVVCLFGYYHCWCRMYKRRKWKYPAIGI